MTTNQLPEFKSHYDYLDAILDHFWLEVFGKTAREMHDIGIVGAHGDKCYGYKDTWQEHDISFERGALLYLLTYTSEMGDNPKHKSSQWVVENYEKYLPKIVAAESKL